MASFQEIINELGLRKEKEGSDRTDYFCPRCDNESGDLSYYKPSHSRGEGFACHGQGGEKAISLLMHVKGWNDVEKAREWFKEHFPEENHDIDQKDIDRKKQAQQVLDKATQISQDTLFKQKQDLLEDIQDRRNFQEEHIKEAGIGFFSNEDAELLKKRFSEQALVDSGLFLETDEGELFSHLQNRIVFPYKSNGSTKFMAGRALPGSDSDNKYKKTIQTDYNKHILYKFTDSDKDSVIITEGFTDTISAWIAGYNVISPATVKFRSKDIDKIQKAVKPYETVYLVNDGDERGQEGAEDTAKALLEEKVDPKMVQLSEDEDLDDWTTENGYNLEQVLEQSEHFLDKKIQEAKDASKRNQTSKSKEVLELVETWDELDVEWILDELPVRKSKLEEKFQQLQDSTEQTEQTEQTEDPNDEHNTLRAKGDTPDIEKLAKERSEIRKRLVGKHNDTFFITIWATYEGVEKPMVVTSNGEMNYIKNKLEEKKKQLEEDQELTEEQEKRFDYQYAEVGGEKVKFKHKIAQSTPSTVNNVDNRLLQLMLDEKEIDKEELFQEVRKTIHDYWSHYREEWFDISTAYAFHTYIAPILGHTAYIMLDGKEDTGKTTWQKVQSRLNYNGWFAGNATPKAVVRYSHNYQVTMHNDEIEKQSDERKTDLQGLYNTGYQKGAVYPIANADRENIEDQVDEIFSFSPKTLTVNDLYGFDDSFISRCVILKAVRTNRKDLKDIDSLKDEEIQRFNDLRAKMAYYCLNNFEEIKQCIESQEDKIDDTARSEEKMSIFRGITEHFVGEKRANKVEEAIRDTQGLQDVNKIAPREREVFEKISNVFEKEDSQLVRIRLSDIAKYVNKELSLTNDGDSPKTTSKAVKKKMMNYDVIRHDEQVVKDSSGYTAVEIERKGFIDSLNRYDLLSFRDKVTSTSSSKDKDSDINPQSAQSAQSAQSNPRNGYPSENEIKNRVEIMADNKPIEIEEVKEFFEETYGDSEKLEKQFDKENMDAGIGSLLNDGEIYEPVPGRVKVL